MEDIARLGITVDSRDVKQAERDLDGMSRSADKAEKNTGGLARSTDKMNTSVRSSLDPLGRMRMLLGGISTLLVARQVIQYSDAWQSANNQLRQVTDSTEHLTSTQSDLLAISNESRSTFESTALLYTRLKQSTMELDVSERDLLTVTEAINKSMVAFGGDATSTNAAIIQLSQGLAAGTLRGEEFNSVSEQAPGIMDAIAEHLQMTRGELRAFAADGGITAEIVIDAMKGAADSIDGDFGKAVATLDQKVTVAKNNLMAFVGGSELVDSSVGVLGDGIIILSENLEHLDIVLLGVSATAVSRFIPAMVTMTGPIGLAAAAVGTLTIAIRELNQISENAAEGAFSYNVSQGARVIELAMYDLAQQIRTTSEEIDALQGNTSAGAAGQMAVLTQQLEEQKAELEAYAEARAALNVETVESEEVDKRWLAVLKQLQDEGSELSKTIAKATEQVDKNTTSIEDNVRAVRDELDLIKRTEREQFILNKTKALGEGATIGQIGATIAYAGALYDETQAIESAEAAEREREKQFKASKAEQERLAEAIQRDWERTRDVFSDAFVDMALSGENAFDSIAKSFERMIATMVADWAASGIMDFIGITDFIGGGGSQTKGGPSIGSSIFNVGGSSIAKSAISGVGSLLGIGGGASALPAAGAGNAAWAGFYGAAPAATTGGLMSSLGSLVTGPAGIAAGVAIAAKLIHDKTSDPDGYTRSNVGFLTAPTPSAAGRTFDVEQFASGFNAVGFNRRGSVADANAVIDQFRFVDQAIVDAVSAAGGSIDLSRATLAGVGEDGRFGTSGTFLGSGGKTKDLQLQIDYFATQLGKHIEGLTPETLARVAGATSAQQIVTILEEVAKTNDENASETRANSEAMAALGNSLQSAGSAFNKVMQSIHAPSTKAGSAGSHFVDGRLVQGGESFAEQWRREQVERNLEMVRNGYSFVTGEWTPTVQTPTDLSSSAQVVSRSSGGDESGQMSDIAMSNIRLSILEKSTADLSRVVRTWETNGMPPERA